MLGHNEIEGYENADQLIKNGVKKQLVAQIIERAALIKMLIN